jgi:hypothetical protein
MIVINKHDLILGGKTKAIYITGREMGDRSTYHMEYQIDTVKEENPFTSDLRPTSNRLYLVKCTYWEDLFSLIQEKLARTFFCSV